MAAPFLTSRLLPSPHGFSMREGGVSEGPWASMNLGFSVGDARERVEENLRRLCTAGRLAEGELATVSQVHGATVLRAGATCAGALQPPLGEADALWTDAPGVAVGVKTADCVPILIADPEGGAVAAVHSGWRGTDARIAARAVEALVAAGAQAARLVAAVGPAIGPCCYEVSEELAARFSDRFGDEAISRRGARAHLDLPAAVALTLRDAGLRADRIDLLGRCTHCEAEVFFSHRRDRGVTGRHLSFIQCGQRATPL